MKAFTRIKNKIRNRIQNRKQKIVTYQIELIKQTTDFLTGITKKTYKITKIIWRNGLVQRIIVGIITLKLILSLIFGNPNYVGSVEFKNVVPIHIEQPLAKETIQMQDLSQNQLVVGSQSPSVSKLLNLTGGDNPPTPLGKGSNPGARARSDAQRAANMKKNSGKSANSKSSSGSSLFVEGFQTPNYSKRGPGDGILGQFGPKPGPNPSNPGCAGGPRSITVINRSKTTSLEMEKPSFISQEKYSKLSKLERRQLPDPKGRDAVIKREDLTELELKLPFNQVLHKTPSHGKTYGLEVNKNNKTPKTEENGIVMRDSIIEMANQPDSHWYMDGMYQGGTPRGCEAINIINKDRTQLATFGKQADGRYIFITTVTPTPIEVDHLEMTNGNFVTEAVLNSQKAVSTEVNHTSTIKNNIDFKDPNNNAI